jgi:hypothetical protein
VGWQGRYAKKMAETLCGKALKAINSIANK